MEYWSKKNREMLLAVGVIAVLTFLFLLNSPMHPWRCAPTATDSSVYKTVAFMMGNGYMPYRDLFDHKGPLMYAINYLGQEITYYRGVWVLEAVSMMVTFFMLYKTARLKANISSSGIVVLLAASMLFKFFEGGNLTEEYAMPFIAVGVYIFLDYLLKGHISWLRIAVSGFSMGAVCLLRINMVTVWVVFGVAILCYQIKEKDWERLWRFVFWFMVGVFSIVGPFCLWLFWNGALGACIEDYLVFNMQYCSPAGGRASLSAQLNSFLSFGSKPVYVMALLGLFCNLKKAFFVNAVYVAYLFVGLIFICLSGMTYGHYGMVLIPAVVYPLSLVAENLESIPDKKVASVIKMLVGIYLATAVLIPASTDMVKKIPKYYANRGQNQFTQTVKEVSNVITNLTTVDECISVYGNQDIYYVWTRRKHATKYSYQFPIGQVMPKIMEEYMQQLSKELPLVIVVQKGRYDKNISCFLNEHQYTKVWPEKDKDLDYAESTLVYYRPK